MQWMVEDIIERRIDQEKHYWRERMAEQQIITDSSSSDSDEKGHLLPIKKNMSNTTVDPFQPKS